MDELELMSIIDKIDSNQLAYMVLSNIHVQLFMDSTLTVKVIGKMLDDIFDNYKDGKYIVKA